MSVKLQHPDSTNRPITVDEERAELLKRNGWVEVDPKTGKQPAE